MRLNSTINFVYMTSTPGGSFVILYKCFFLGTSSVAKFNTQISCFYPVNLSHSTMTDANH